MKAHYETTMDGYVVSCIVTLPDSLYKFRISAEVMHNDYPDKPLHLDTKWRSNKIQWHYYSHWIYGNGASNHCTEREEYIISVIGKNRLHKAQSLCIQAVKDYESKLRAWQETSIIYRAMTELESLYPMRSYRTDFTFIDATFLMENPNLTRFVWILGDMHTRISTTREHAKVTIEFTAKECPQDHCYMWNSRLGEFTEFSPNRSVYNLEIEALDYFNNLPRDK